MGSTGSGGRAAAGTGGQSAAGSGGQSAAGSGGSTAMGGLTRRVRRLSNREYDNVVRDLLGDTTRPSQRFMISDSFPNGYDNGSDGLAVQSDQVVDYQVAAESLAATAVVDRLPALLNGCDPASRGDDACREAFLAYLPPRAFRRPLTSGELDRLRTVYAVGAETGGLASGVQLVLETLLQSPELLYREELGPPDAMPDRAGQVALTPHEIASELSQCVRDDAPYPLIELPCWCPATRISGRHPDAPRRASGRPCATSRTPAPR